ncbi:hypothetical protein ACFLR2_00580 [Chlamydiota bacterium]
MYPVPSSGASNHPLQAAVMPAGLHREYKYFSVAFCAIGGVGIVFGAPVLVSGVLLNAGLAGTKYAFGTETRNFKESEYGNEFLVGGAAGVVSGIFSKIAQPAGRLVCRVVSSITNVGTKKILKDDPKDPRTLLESVAVSGVAAACGFGAGEGLNKVLGEVPKECISVIWRGAAEGAVDAGAGQVATNVLTIDPKTNQRHNWNDDLLFSMALGGAIGAVAAIPEAMEAKRLSEQHVKLDTTDKDIKAREAKREDLKDNIKKLEGEGYLRNTRVNCVDCFDQSKYSTRDEFWDCYRGKFVDYLANGNAITFIKYYKHTHHNHLQEQQNRLKEMFGLDVILSKSGSGDSKYYEFTWQNTEISGLTEASIAADRQQYNADLAVYNSDVQRLGDTLRDTNSLYAVLCPIVTQTGHATSSQGGSPIARQPAAVRAEGPVERPPAAVPVARPPEQAPVDRQPAAVPAARQPEQAPVDRQPAVVFKGRSLWTRNMNRKLQPAKILAAVPAARQPAAVPVARPPEPAPVERQAAAVPVAARQPSRKELRARAFGLFKHLFEDILKLKTTDREYPSYKYFMKTLNNATFNEGAAEQLFSIAKKRVEGLLFRSEADQCIREISQIIYF